MVTVVHSRDLMAKGSRTATFEGEHHGSGISFFHVDNDPGQGPGMHTHPYSETWIVLSGEALVTVDSEEIDARKGDIVTVDAGTSHMFRNSGNTRLELMCIHVSPRFVTEWLDDELGKPA